MKDGCVWTVCAHHHQVEVATLAEEFDSHLTLMQVLHNHSDDDSSSQPIIEAFHQLQGIVPKDSTLAYAPEIVMEFGSVWQRIVNTAAERDADLIVLGAHPLNCTTHILWSTVHKVVANAACPVLTVRTQV